MKGRVYRRWARQLVLEIGPPSRVLALDEIARFCKVKDALDTIEDAHRRHSVSLPDRLDRLENECLVDVGNVDAAENRSNMLHERGTPLMPVLCVAPLVVVFVDVGVT
jgi:hypothetical protein